MQDPISDAENEEIRHRVDRSLERQAQEFGDDPAMWNRATIPDTIIEMLIDEIDRLRAAYRNREPAGPLVFVAPPPDEQAYAPRRGFLTCRECDAIMTWSPWTGEWWGRHERGCQTGAGPVGNGS